MAKHKEQVVIEMLAEVSGMVRDMKKAREEGEKTQTGLEAAFAKIRQAARATGDVMGKALVEGLDLVKDGVFATSAAMAAATVQATAFARELEIASNRSGESVENLQSMAFATKTVGVDLEKLGDISKDTNEKVGEFLATGGGGFMDFVDVMKLNEEQARKVAAEFQNMTGTEVLQAMVSQMEDAGISANKMSFALEGMASDTTDLIPLLRDGGKEMKRLRDDFNKLGITITNVDIERLKDIGEGFSTLGSEIQTSSSKVVSVLADDINAVIDQMSGMAGDIGGIVVKAVTGYQVIVQEATAFIANMFREAEIKALQAQSFLVGLFGDNSELIKQIKALEEEDVMRDAFDVSFLEQQWADATEKLREYKGEVDTVKQSPALGGAPSEGAPEPPQRGELFGYTDEELDKRAEFLAAETQLEIDAQNERIRLWNLYYNKNKQLAEQEAKDQKKREAQKLQTAQNAINLGMALNSKFFEDNKAINAGLIVADTAAGIQKSLAMNPMDWVNPALIAASGALQLSNAMSASKGGGSISGGGGAPIQSTQQPQQEAEPTQTVSVTDLTDSGVITGRETVSGGSGFENMFTDFVRDQQLNGNLNGMVR